MTTAETAELASESEFIPPHSQRPAAQPAAGLAHSFAHRSRHSLWCRAPYICQEGPVAILNIVEVMRNTTARSTGL